MAVALEQFVKHLEDSGILAGDTLKNYIPPKATPKDAEELARELVKQKKLTKFQAEEVYRGKGKSLVLGNYVLMEKIGAGGMGEVYKAEHRRMHRIVAIKLLPSAMTNDKAAIARFEREVTAAAKISHPNIVAAHDADCANGVHFLVMELVEGKDLSALVKKNGPISVEKAVNYVLQAAKGLEAAHKKGIVHRDIKPANLLLDTEGTVKILDMGLARLGGVGDDAPQADLTSTGTIMGTVDYMAPEQALDTKTADARADIYALGCSLHYLLTGKATYEGDTLMKKLLAHREQPIPSLHAARPEVPAELEAVYNKMLAKRVEDRYQTMMEVISDLEPWEFGQEATVIIPKPASIPPSTNTIADNSATFIQKPKATTATQGKAGPPPWKNPQIFIGAAFLGVLLISGIIVSLQTKDGKLIVEVDQSDAIVQVLDAEGKVEISQKGVDDKIVISVDPGKHRLRVEKDGYTVFGQEFVMKKGGKTEITAKLVPLEEKPAMVETTTAPVAPMTLPVAGEKKRLAFQLPGFDEWVEKVAAMPAEQQAEAVNQKLVELNPGFDGKVTPTIDGGAVTGLQFTTENVTDISPVRVLVGLQHLDCSGEFGGKGELSDLSPVKGMPLIYFELTDTQLSDLSPLKGMPLTDLDCGKTKVSDLSPLRGMPLKQLRYDFKSERDTELLRSIKTLETINDKPAAEFWKEVDARKESFDKWMADVATMPAEQQVEAVSKKLMELNPGFDGKVNGWNGQGEPTIQSGVVIDLNFRTDTVTDISPVRALVGLKTLVCTGSEPGKGKLSELAPLKGMSLINLDLSFNEVSDLSPLKVMILNYFNCSWTQVSDLSTLKGMPLASLHMQYTTVADLLPLKGMPLTELTFDSTQVSDLSPLKGMLLTKLQCSSTQVSDISPLQGMPLTHLVCYETKVSDLSPIKDIPLKQLALDFKPERDTALLRSIKTLETINGKPTADFWKETEEMWVKQVQAMPAEQQVEAVSKKLVELNPGFDGKFTGAYGAGTPTIQNGRVTAIAVLTDYVTDISPVRALKSLNVFEFQCSDGGEGQLSDLSPLKDIKLTDLSFWKNKVSDLSPLKDMKLIRFTCGYMPTVSDLSPLQGMPLELLVCGGSNVADLTPLKGMPLKELWCGQTPVADLTPLKGMMLSELRIDNSKVSDLSPLRGMPLLQLHCDATSVTDLSPLKQMPLKHLRCDFKPARDTELLRSIKTLETINDKPAAEFWKEVEGMPGQ